MSQLTIGECLDRLNEYDDSRTIEIVSTDELIAKLQGAPYTNMFLTGYFGSYRGYYEDMHVAFSYADEGYNTVGKMKSVLNEALSEGTMSGYKGGNYSVNLYTAVWLAFDSGDCSNLFVSGVTVVNGVLTVLATGDR